MTLILFAPAAVSTTLNSVFSSTAGAAAAPAARSRYRHRGRGRRYAKFLFEQLDQLRRLEQRQSLNLFCILR